VISTCLHPLWLNFWCFNRKRLPRTCNNSTPGTNLSWINTPSRDVWFDGSRGAKISYVYESHVTFENLSIFYYEATGYGGPNERFYRGLGKAKPFGSYDVFISISLKETPVPDATYQYELTVFWD